MKPFIGIDLTQDKNNEQYNGQKFVVKKPSEVLSQALEKTGEESIDMITKKSQLPLAVRIIYWALGILGFSALMGLIRFLIDDEMSIGEAYTAAPLLFFAIAGCLIVWLVVFVIARKKEKSILESDENKNIDANWDIISANIFSELSVPLDAKAVDIISFTYKIKNGKIKPCEKGFELSPYCNYEYRIFKDAENLYLANLDEKYAISLSSLKAIHTVKKNVTVPLWNKDEEYNKGIYKRYKIREGKYGDITFKSYHILEFEHCREVWGIYFPNYELPVFEEITGLRAEK